MVFLEYLFTKSVPLGRVVVHGVDDFVPRFRRVASRWSEPAGTFVVQIDVEAAYSDRVTLLGAAPSLSFRSQIRCLLRGLPLLRAGLGAQHLPQGSVDTGRWLAPQRGAECTGRLLPHVVLAGVTNFGRLH